MEQLTDRLGEFALIAGVALALGFAIDTIIYRVIRTQARKRGWRVGDAIAHSLHGLPTLLAALIAIRLITVALEIDTEVESTFKSVLLAVAIAGFTWSATRLAGRLTRIFTQGDDAPIPSSTIFVNLARGTVVAIGAASVLAALGISIGPLIAALGVGGIAIGLALQPTLENLFAGIQVLLSRQIGPGDFIRLETGEEGWVEDMNWRNTTIKSLSNDLIIVPNSVIGRSRITNFTSADEQHVEWVPVGVAYGSDLELVERVTLDEARAVLAALDYGVDDYEPLLRFDAFGDSSVDLRVSIKARSYSDRWPIRSELIKRLHARYAAEGIEIPFPQRVVHFPGGAPATDDAR